MLDKPLRGLISDLVNVFILRLPVHAGLEFGHASLNSSPFPYSDLLSCFRAFPAKLFIRLNHSLINSSPPSAAYMRQWTGPSLVQIMACRLFGVKPLPDPMLVYRQLDSCEQVSVKFISEFYHFHSRKCVWKCRLPRWRPFCPGGRWVKGLAGHGYLLVEFNWILVLSRLWLVEQYLLISRKTGNQIGFKLNGYIHYGISRTWSRYFLDCDWPSSFHTFSDKPIMELAVHFVGAFIVGLPMCDRHLVTIYQIPFFEASYLSSSFL